MAKGPDAAVSPDSEYAAHRTTAIEFDAAVLAKLRREAAARDLSVPTLVRRLVEVIAADGLTKAILADDD